MTNADSNCIESLELLLMIDSCAFLIAWHYA